MANSVDPDEMAHEPSHQDLHCLQKFVLVCRAEMVKANTVKKKKKKKIAFSGRSYTKTVE